MLHHTPDCVRAFATMAELVPPGGQLAVYVYRKKAIIRELVDDHVIDMTARLSFEECLELSEQLTELGRELSRTGATVKLEHGVPLLGIEPGEHDVQRLIYWTMLKCFWNEDLGWHQSVMVNYDWYSPVFRSRHTEEEVLGWCRDAGLEVEHLDVIESGISVRALPACAEDGSGVRPLRNVRHQCSKLSSDHSSSRRFSRPAVILDQRSNAARIEELVDRGVAVEQLRAT